MQSLATVFRHVKGYFWLALALFFFSIFLGFYSQGFHDLLDQQLMELGELAGQLNEAENPGLAFFIFIFLNNTIKSIAIMYAGLLLGILPIFFIVINGMLIGYLLFVFQENVTHVDLSVTELVVRGLLPHGIIEIPVIIVAAAYGLLLGVAVLDKLFSYFRRNQETDPGSVRHEKSLRALLRNSKYLVWFIIVSLLIAALIEAYITPKLLTL